MGSSMRPLLVAVICIFSVCCRSLAFLTSTPGFVPLLLLSQLITVNTLPVNMCSLKPKIVVGKPNCFDSIFGLPRRDLLSGAAAVGASFASSLASEAAEPDVGAAIRSFNQGQYEDSLKEWSALTTSKPSVGLYWSNRGTIELILGSKQASLGVAPTGEARELLEASVSSLERAVSLDKVDDTLTLNNLGNAQAVLLQWEAAGASYDRALAAAQARDRSIASIPASNRAQVSVELGDLEDAEKRVVSLLRVRDYFSILYVYMRCVFLSLF